MLSLRSLALTRAPPTPESEHGRDAIIPAASESFTSQGPDLNKILALGRAPLTPYVPERSHDVDVQIRPCETMPPAAGTSGHQNNLGRPLVDIQRDLLSLSK